MAAVGEVAPTILTSTGREVVRVPWELVSAVDACDALLRRYGMQMQIICEDCHARGVPHPYIQGNNARGGATFTMTCAHAERRYDFSVK